MPVLAMVGCSRRLSIFCSLSKMAIKGDLYDICAFDPGEDAQAIEAVGRMMDAQAKNFQNIFGRGESFLFLYGGTNGVAFFSVIEQRQFRHAAVSAHDGDVQATAAGVW